MLKKIIVVTALALAPFAASASQLPDYPFVHASGNGSVYVAPDVGEIDFEPEADDGTDPLARKLELAEEFRQIGDMEGARDLLEEVVAKSSGALRSKAQAMLDALG